jgi:hypothetical protein
VNGESERRPDIRPGGQLCGKGRRLGGQFVKTFLLSVRYQGRSRGVSKPRPKFLADLFDDRRLCLRFERLI